MLTLEGIFQLMSLPRSHFLFFILAVSGSYRGDTILYPVFLKQDTKQSAIFMNKAQVCHLK